MFTNVLSGFPLDRARSQNAPEPSAFCALRSVQSLRRIIILHLHSASKYTIFNPFAARLSGKPAPCEVGNRSRHFFCPSRFNSIVAGLQMSLHRSHPCARAPSANLPFFVVQKSLCSTGEAGETIAKSVQSTGSEIVSTKKASAPVQPAASIPPRSPVNRRRALPLTTAPGARKVAAAEKSPAADQS